jgi:hypothetical protein
MREVHLKNTCVILQGRSIPLEGQDSNSWPPCGLEDGCCCPDCTNDSDCYAFLPKGTACKSDSECCNNKCRGGKCR